MKASDSSPGMVRGEIPRPANVYVRMKHRATILPGGLGALTLLASLFTACASFDYALPPGCEHLSFRPTYDAGEAALMGTREIRHRFPFALARCHGRPTPVWASEEHYWAWWGHLPPNDAHPPTTVQR